MPVGEVPFLMTQLTYKEWQNRYEQHVTVRLA